MKLAQIAFRNIRRNKRRSILSITATAIAAMAMVLMFSLITGMADNMKYNLQTYYTGEVRVRHRMFDKNEDMNPLHLRITEYGNVMETITSLDGVASISPRISFPAMIYIGEENYRGMGMGVDVNLEKHFQDMETALVQGRLPEKGKKETLLGVGLAEEMGVAPGDKITLVAGTMRRSTNGITLTITGLTSFPLSAMNSKFFLVPLDTIQSFLRMGDSVSEILIKLKKGTSSIEIEETLNKLFQTSGFDDIAATSWEHIPTSYTFMEIAGAVYNIMALVFFILASSVIINTTMMVIFERMREIGTIRAMGMTGGEIVRLFFLEAAYLGVLGSLFGVIIGIIITIPLSKTGFSFGAAMEGVSFEISDIIYPRLSMKSTIVVFFYSSIIAALSSLFPSRRASKITPVEALRSL